MDESSEGKREYFRTDLYLRPGNNLKRRDRAVTRLLSKVRGAAPWLEASDFASLRAWAELELLSRQAYSILRTYGLLNSKGEPRRLLTDYRQLRATQNFIAGQLGLTTSSRIALKSTATNAALDLSEAEASEIIAASNPSSGADLGPPSAAKGPRNDFRGESDGQD